MKDIFIEHDGKTLSVVHSGEKITDAVSFLDRYPSVYIVCDHAVEVLARELEASNIKGIKAVDADENRKDMETVLDICSWLLDKGADRYSMVLAVGGGITTDMAGFAASIFKRGIRFAYIPTTLLSQVDAAIGGKTGVNFAGLKNMLGVIRQPEFTYECPEPLETLPYNEFKGGSAEMLKTFMIENHDDNYGKAVRCLSSIYAAEDKAFAIKSRRAVLLELIHAAAAVKAGIVGRDQFEKGERRKLNLGHTFAHAIEKESAYGVSHGEAVSIGMAMAAELSDRLGITDGNLAERLSTDLESCGLPVKCPVERTKLAAAMEKDKKAENGIMHFVLMKNIGDVIIKDMNVKEAL